MNNKIKTIAALLSLSCAAAASMNSLGAIKAFNPFIAENVEQPANKHVIDQYAYAPATVYHDGYFHQFYCSTGGHTDMHFYDFSDERSTALKKSWDHIRYRYSKNGSDWSSPFIVITQSPGKNGENCTCDPAIVYNENDKYWYLFYQGALKNWGGAVYVARSKGLRGPFEKYSKVGNTVKWDRWTKNPTPLLKKKTNKEPNSANGYGVGQISVVYKDNKFHFWFNQMMNDKFVVYNDKNEKVMYTKRFHVAVDNITDLANLNMGESYDDPVDSRIHIVTHSQPDSAMSAEDKFLYKFPSHSEKWHFSDFGEVRWNTGTEQFEMWLPDRVHGYMMRVKKYHSDDGDEWTKDNKGSRSYNVVHQNDYMDWIHNIGVSGDKFGHIHDDKYLLSFSAPKWSSSYSNDDFTAAYTNSSNKVAQGLWPMWEILNGSGWQTIPVNYDAVNNFDVNSSKRLQFFVGDFDGDGIDELGAAERLDNGMFKWYLQSSKNPSNNRKSETWGKTWRSTAVGGVENNQYKVMAGDYDGDGKTDFGVIVYHNNNAYWRIHSSKENKDGVPNIPINLTWNNIPPSYAFPIGDYDGDGIVDKAVFQQSSKQWNLYSSIDGQPIKMRKITGTDETCNDGPAEHATLPIIAETGIDASNLTPVAADYDGDHITDLALLDPHGNLYIRSSQTGCHLKWNYTNPNGRKTKLTLWPYKLTENSDLLGKYLAADFDGDGIADHMILNESTGASEIHLSRGGLYVDYSFSFPILANLTSKEILIGDFDGNGHSDICIIDLNTNNYYIYFFRIDYKYYGDLPVMTLKKSRTASRPVKYVDFSSSYPYSLAKKAVKPAEPEITQEKAMPRFNAYVQDQKLVVSNTLAGQKVFVFDMRGKEISRKVSNGLDMTFDIPNKGMYIVRSGDAYRKISIK